MCSRLCRPKLTEENILYLMEHRKIIFFQMGVPDYLTSETPKKKVYDAHALCIIMIPREDSYDCYYINSHGHTIDTQDYYEFIMSNKRINHFFTLEPHNIMLCMLSFCYNVFLHCFIDSLEYILTFIDFFWFINYLCIITFILF